MKTRFARTEKKHICNRLISYGVTANPRECQFFWDDTLNEDNGILGKFKLPNAILVPLALRNVAMTEKMLDSTLAHELKHYEQRNRQGLVKYSLLNFLGFNEDEAKDEEYRIDRLTGLSAYNKRERREWE